MFGRIEKPIHASLVHAGHLQNTHIYVLSYTDSFRQTPICAHSTQRVKATSKLSYLRAAIREPGFGHVLSFRRKIYIDASDVAKIPESFVIYHDDIRYRIFLSIEKVIGSLRTRQDHVTKRCYINDKSTKTIVGNTIRSNDDASVTKVIDSDTKNNGINDDDDTCTKNTVVNSLVEISSKKYQSEVKEF